ncbi:MAG: 50S ribosomal protein L11 methyltransferase [bacterium]
MDKIKILLFYLQPKNINLFQNKNEELNYIYKSFITFFLLYKTYYVGFISYNTLIVVFKDFDLLLNPLKMKNFLFDFFKFVDKFKYKLDFTINFSYRYITKELLNNLILSSEDNITQDIFKIIRNTNEAKFISEIKDRQNKKDQENLNRIDIYLSPTKYFSEGTGSHITTKLMLNNIYKSIKFLRKILVNSDEYLPNTSKEIILIDYGSGSGILSISMLKVIYYLLKEINIKKELRIFSIDINFNSCLETKKNVNLNLKGLENYNVKTYFINSPNIYFLEKIFINKFYFIILLSNVPINVLKMLFIYDYDFFIISGIKSNLDLFKNDQFYKNLEDNYDLQLNIKHNWISLIGLKK